MQNDEPEERKSGTFQILLNSLYDFLNVLFICLQAEIGPVQCVMVDMAMICEHAEVSSDSSLHETSLFRTIAEVGSLLF